MESQAIPTRLKQTTDLLLVLLVVAVKPEFSAAGELGESV